MEVPHRCVTAYFGKQALIIICGSINVDADSVAFPVESCVFKLSQGDPRRVAHVNVGCERVIDVIPVILLAGAFPPQDFFIPMVTDVGELGSRIDFIATVTGKLRWLGCCMAVPYVEVLRPCPLHYCAEQGKK